MRISLIIPTKDRNEILSQTLERIKDAIDGEDAEVIVVNDSKINNVLPEKGISNLKIIQNQGSGVASARNTGAAEANSPILWFLDDDMWISKEMFKQSLELIKKYPKSIFNFNWEYPDYLLEKIRKEPFGRFLEHIEFTTMKGWCKGAKWDDDQLFPTNWLAGATLLIPKEIYLQVGGYNPTFPLAGFEDHDFSVRVQQKGISCYIEPRFIAFHNEVNKTNLHGFIARTHNNAITRRHAVTIGYKDQRIDYPFYKSISYRLLDMIRPLLLKLLDFWPNIKFMDPLYFRLCHLLIGTAIFKGYSKGI